MTKDQTRSAPHVEFDTCRNCGAFWFDAGELAMVQQAYEAGPRRKQAEIMKQRYAEMEASPERRARFEKNLAAMPKGPDGLIGAIGQGLTESAGTVVEHTVIAANVGTLAPVGIAAGVAALILAVRNRK